VTSGTYRWLNTGNHQVRNVFQQEAASLHLQQRLLFERIGVQLHRCLTNCDAYQLFARVSGF
jgi:hypothetical protein